MDRFFQKIEVSVHKEIAGQWQPDRFLWQGRMYTILEIGRRWQDLDGEHILVMILAARYTSLFWPPIKSAGI